MNSVIASIDGVTGLGNSVNHAETPWLSTRFTDDCLFRMSHAEKNKGTTTNQRWSNGGGHRKNRKVRDSYDGRLLRRERAIQRVD